MSGIPLGFSDCLEIPDMSGAQDLTRSPPHHSMTMRSGFLGSRPSQPHGSARHSPAYLHVSHAIPSWMLVLEIELYSLIHSFND